MSQRFAAAFEKRKPILSVYTTAGFPELTDTVRVCEELERAGAHMIELGIPFSDPVADGETIQRSSEVALKNGMTLKLLLEQLKELRGSVTIPVLLMGYLNPLLQYGMEKFCEEAAKLGIDGMIIPDLPLAEYVVKYKKLFKERGLHNILLVTSRTTDERVKMIDAESTAFIYLVSSAATTGVTLDVDREKEEYFKRIDRMGLQHPALIGFGISDKMSFKAACKYARGAIVGSAFIRAMEKEGDLKTKIERFVKQFIS